MKSPVFSRKSLGAVLILVLLSFCGCNQSPEAKSAKFLSRGKQLLEKKDPARAILEFQNALKATPKNAEVYFQLARAYLANSDFRRGISSLRNALALDPRHFGSQLGMAQILASVNDPDSLKDAQQRLLSLLAQAPQNLDVLQSLALTDLKLEQPGDAVEHLETALALAPQNLVSAFALAQAKMSQNDLNGAEQILKKACSDAPKSTEAPVMLGRFYISQKRLPEAEQQFNKALAIDPANGEALSNLAALQNQAGRKQEAEQSFKRLSTSPDSTLNAMYGMFLFQEGRRDEALREFERLFKADPGDRPARTRLVAAYQSANRMEDAFKILNGALKNNPKDLDALLQRGELLLDSKKLDDAESDLNRVLHLRPDSAEAHYAVARLSRARGNGLIYRQELSEVLRINPLLLGVRVELAKALIADNSAKAALAALDDASSAEKGMVPWIEQRNWALIDIHDGAQARAGIDRGLALARTPDLLLQDALLKIASRRFPEARSSLKEAMGKTPSDIRLLRALVASYAAQKQVPAAVAEVRSHAAANPKSAEVQYFLGNLLLETGDQAQARQVFTTAVALNPGYTPASLELARMNLVHADWTSARPQLTAILSTSQGENPLARLWLGMLEEAVGNHAGAIAAFQKVVDLQPNNPTALNNLAYLLAENTDQTDQALKYAQKAQELEPESARTQDTLGWILYRKGVYPSAVKYLEMANAKEPTAVRKFHLAMAYLKAGDKALGKTTLEAALRLNPQLPEARAAQDLFK